MKKFLYILIALTSPLYNYAQNVGNDEDATEIVTNAKREVEPASRILSAPKMIDTVVNYKVVEYPMLPVRYETTIKMEPILPANVKLSENKMLKLYNGYVRAGIGSTFMPLGEIYYNNTRSRKYVWGANIKHLSSYGELKGYAPANFDRTHYNAFGGIKQLNYSLLGDVHFNNYGVNRYGVEKPNASKDSISQRFKEIGGQVKFLSHKMDSLKLNYVMQLDVYNLKDKKPSDAAFANYFGNENNIALTTNFWYRKGKETFAVDVNLNNNHFVYGNTGSKMNILDSAINNSNTLFTLKPSITTFAKNNKLKAQIGVDLNASKSEQTTFAIYPIADVKYSMFDNVIIPYVGVKGGMKQNTFKSLSAQNAFMQSNPNLKNESTPYNAYLGVKGILTKQMEFNVFASFSEVRNKALFISDSSAIHSNLNQFIVVYDTIKIFNAEASLSYQLDEKLKLDAIARFYNYEAKNNSYAWNLPVYQFIVRGNYVFKDKFIFNLDLNGEGGRKALTYDSLEANTSVENGQIIKNLGFILDANLGVEYRYTRRISAFLQFNNVAAQQYFRWYKYPVQAFQIMGGVTFKF